MNVSVIVPTFNGQYRLPGIINSLKNQTFKDFELIIVNDGSTDNTEEISNELIKGFKTARVINQQNGGRSAVRNKGSLFAQGELLIFFDDDMLLPVNAIYEHMIHHKEHPNSILTGEYREPVFDKTPEFYKFKNYLRQKWNSSFNIEDKSLIDEKNLYLAAGNLSISKHLFNKLGGFDERLTDAEDFDLARKALNLKIPMFFSRLAYSIHNETVNCKTYIKRMREYSLAHKKLVEINPELYKNSTSNIPKPKGLKAKIFRLFCYDWWVSSVDNGSWIWLPSLVRFKLYDIIITANTRYTKVTF